MKRPRESAMSGSKSKKDSIPEMKISIKTKRGKTYFLDVESFDGVDNIEANINDNDSNYRVVLRSEGVEQVLRKECVKQINVKTLAGENVCRLVVESSDKIESVLEKVESRKGIPPRDMRLFFQGKVLESGRTLADYNIQDNSTLYLHVVLGSKCVNQIKVKGITGKTFQLDVESSEKLESVMEKIRIREGIASHEELRLVFGWLNLERSRTLADYNIQNDDTLFLVLTLRA